MLAAVGCALSAVMIAGCTGDGDGESPEKTANQKGLGQANAPYWVNPEGKAAKQHAEFVKADQDEEAELIEKIAGQPAAEWLGVENPEAEARGFTEAAEKADRSALLVIYNIPHRDCGQHSAGGAADGDAYRAFLDGVVKGIGEREATVIVEPDALPHLLQDGCVPEDLHEERYALLREAVEKLKGLPATKVYLDAGNPGFPPDPGLLVEPLQRSGIEAADGFAVNVSNFETTAASTEYGKKLSGMTGGKHFVIDTARNGNGPWTEGGADGWCNPPGRALGEAPTDETGDELVDAYMWIKRPGESDGECRGGPAAGEWWAEYALGLARNSR